MGGPLRINLADDKKTSGIEMGKSILKPMSGNKVAPILDETSILKDSSLVSIFKHLLLIIEFIEWTRQEKFYRK
jgi:hypothetical protein